MDVLLLHGAFRGAWSWQGVVPLLEGAGHRVVAPDLPGAGDRFATDAEPVGLEGHLDDLEAVVEGESLHRAVVVGHSQGGFLARALSQRFPERIAVLAYLDAPVPAHGQTAFDLLPGGGPPPDIPRNTVVPATPVAAGPGVSEEQAAWISQHLTPQSVALSFDPVVLDDPRALALPEAHAFCELTPETYPCATTRAALDASGRSYTLLAAGHDAPVTHPSLVADWVCAIASTVDAGSPAALP